MNTLETMGNVQILALEGQRQIAAALASWLKDVVRRLVHAEPIDPALATLRNRPGKHWIR